VNRGALVRRPVGRPLADRRQDCAISGCRRRTPWTFWPGPPCVGGRRIRL